MGIYKAYEKYNFSFNNYGFRKIFFLWSKVSVKLATDNCPLLCSDKSKLFLKNNGIFHIKIALYNPWSNGTTKNLVHTFKSFLKKCFKF